MGWLGLVSVTAGVEALAHFNRCLPYDLLSSHAVAAGMRLHHICAVAVESRLGAEANVGAALAMHVYDLLRMVS
jgi:hypothetical protein